jgi:hypothetical protein
MQPESHGFQIQWILNDTIIAENVDEIKIKGDHLLSENVVMVMVTDTTDFVKDTDDLPLLTESVSWRIIINNQVQVKNMKHIVPSRFQLYPCYPNPFNPTTKIGYNLNESTDVILKIYNLSGQELETLVNGFQTTGEREITW